MTIFINCQSVSQSVSEQTKSEEPVRGSLLALPSGPVVGIFSQNADCWGTKSTYRPAVEQEGFSQSCLFGENLGFLLTQHKAETIEEGLETVEEDLGTGASSRHLAGLASGVSDALRSASNCCLPDCLPLQVILNCCEGGTPKETMEKLLHRMSEDKTLTAESLVKLLQAVKPMSPNLGLMLENLQRLATWPSTTGIS